MRNRQAAKVALQNLHTVSQAYGQLPSEVLKQTTIDEYSFNLFVLREGQPKEGK